MTESKAYKVELYSNDDRIYTLEHIKFTLTLKMTESIAYTFT